MSEYRCNFIVPGFAKCGTSSLHEYLSLHPRICMSREKEPHFFALDSKFVHGAEEHNLLFQEAPSPVNWFGESSTLYAVWEPALFRIFKHLDEPKLILLLRHPVQRLLSHYRWMYALGLERQRLRDALQTEQSAPVRPEISRRGCYPWYLRHSNYSYFCELIIALFGRERVLLLRSEDLLKSPQCTLGYCTRFLGLEPMTVENDIQANRTRDKTAQRTLGLDRLIKPIVPAWREAVDPNYRLRAWVKRCLGTHKRRAPEPTASDLAYISELLTEDVEYYEDAFSVAANEAR